MWNRTKFISWLWPTSPDKVDSNSNNCVELNRKCRYWICSMPHIIFPYCWSTICHLTMCQIMSQILTNYVSCSTSALHISWTKYSVLKASLQLHVAFNIFCKGIPASPCHNNTFYHLQLITAALNKLLWIILDNVCSSCNILEWYEPKKTSYSL